MKRIRRGKNKRLFCFLLALVLLAGSLLAALLSNLSGTLAAPAGNAYTIDVNDYYGSLSVPGPGYSFSYNAQTYTGILTFSAAASGNHYTITRSNSSSGAGSLTGIVFQQGSSPASVTMVGLSTLKEGITLPGDFTSDLSFRRYNGGYCDLKTTSLTLPTGYKGNLDINGLKVGTLKFPSDYDLPITFNGLEITTALTYPANYNGPITIGGSFKVPANQQFPSGYSGPIIIGDEGGVFDIVNTICRAGASIGWDSGIFIPNNRRGL